MNPIVGIGELLWDVYPDGHKVAGGAPFNFAFHCHQLGHPSVIVSRVGDDDLGHELRERVRELGLSDEYIQTDPEHPTGTVRVTLGANAIPTYTITEYVAWDYIAWEDRLEALAASHRAVCFGTLAQRFGTPVPVHRFTTPRRTTALAVFDVNLRGSYFDVDRLEWGLSVCDWCKINADELNTLRALLGCSTPNELAQEWMSAFAEQAVIVTHGEGGCEIYHQRESRDAEGDPLFPSEAFAVPGVKANVVDTVGAGDAFTAAMVCLHLEGKPLREAARFAVHYAARVCEQPGGTPRIARAEVERAAGLR
ncbi:putative sugar kinase YdjH [Gemmata obscuriglobus]|uniref:Carbohydrate kinase n=1 Tax=Gemmata obscuriglobus TaxID=114 RepID=A0A2Z3H9B9_9BACT|nr:PfkB family carbohydrate kinase [Gemmata obscuriglobus]AWM41032.1 carbohydrate kinase [Gemmata obscuriglobus]QEG25647.1 putative sugar kinase YdjH [Gemmata obscuriglobus]VTR99211.1 family : Kinase, PfkB family OS=Porphyromonas sp. oral taxon 278 str. W7784 GN=HMPREF1556_00125 PE=4 SV=1: PfkB [Gemmata obscuriglobus UQM 2246]